MPQIVQAYATELGGMSRRVPDALNVHDMRALLRARQHVRVVLHLPLFQVAKQGGGAFSKRAHALSCLRVAEAQKPTLEVHIFPLERQNLALAAAGEGQEADRSHDVGIGRDRSIRVLGAVLGSLFGFRRLLVLWGGW